MTLRKVARFSGGGIIDTLARCVVVICCTISGLMTSLPAHAQSYPNKLITIVVPFGAGSASDLNARLYAQALKDTLNASSVVEIKPGANGMIGARVVATAAPDGYTILMGSGTVNAANYAIYPGLIAYKPQQFEPVAILYLSPAVLYAAKELPGDTVQEMLRNAKSTGRQLTCGSGNAVTQVACEILRLRTGADMVGVPYGGNVQSLSGVAGGQISLAFADVVAAEGLVSSGLIRPLAVSGLSRLAASPDVKTFAEQAIPDFDFLSWNGLFVPAGTPKDVIAKLNQAALHMLASPEWEKQRVIAGGLKVTGDLQQSQAFLASEITRWELYARESHVKIE
jgi:putative tricarboxylic transport membrane protein